MQLPLFRFLQDCLTYRYYQLFQIIYINILHYFLEVYYEKKITIRQLTLSMVAALFLPFAASAASVGVKIDNVPVSFNDSSGYPFIDAPGRTQVPLRAAMEAYGCSVQWDASALDRCRTEKQGPVKASLFLRRIMEL